MRRWEEEKERWPTQSQYKSKSKKIGDIETWYYKCAVDVNINYQKNETKQKIKQKK